MPERRGKGRRGRGTQPGAAVGDGADAGVTGPRAPPCSTARGGRSLRPPSSRRASEAAMEEPGGGHAAAAPPRRLASGSPPPPIPCLPPGATGAGARDRGELEPERGRAVAASSSRERLAGERAQQLGREEEASRPPPSRGSRLCHHELPLLCFQPRHRAPQHAHGVLVAVPTCSAAAEPCLGRTGRAAARREPALPWIALPRA